MVEFLGNREQGRGNRDKGDTGDKGDKGDKEDTGDKGDKGDKEYTGTRGHGDIINISPRHSFTASPRLLPIPDPQSPIPDPQY
ncbi:hypothetical protein AMR41_06215 [Hapalosiphon sp. MRB220]|nr:hypothetical protein AMR41_06215 [Hapalosiphon sp. MRB220]